MTKDPVRGVRAALRPDDPKARVESRIRIVGSTTADLTIWRDEDGDLVVCQGKGRVVMATNQARLVALALLEMLGTRADQPEFTFQER